MLKPNVGEIVSIASPLNFFKIVVFPALSRPLRTQGGGSGRGGKEARRRPPSLKSHKQRALLCTMHAGVWVPALEEARNSQHQHAHLLLLLLQLAQNFKQPHGRLAL